MKPDIERIFIDERSKGAALTERIVEAFPRAAIDRIPECTPEYLTGGPTGSRATTLCISHYRGNFVKSFPTHPWYRQDASGGCDHNLLIGYNCSAACRYCFTRTYFDTPYPTLFSNVDDMLDSLGTFLHERPDGRVSTGEFTDSFFLDEVTGTNGRIMKMLDTCPGAVLELRTKSAGVDHMPPAAHPGVVAAWSINPPGIIESTEIRTARFHERLAGARTLKEKGYRIALRFDPVIMAETYAGAYAGLADLVEEELSWTQVSELFLGAIRFDKRMIGELAGRQVPEKLLDAQHILCPDGKYRPNKFVRLKFYKSIIDGVRRHAPDISIHLTMEPAYIHDAVLPPSE
jgi:spore photoproduct lyase